MADLEFLCVFGYDGGLQLPWYLAVWSILLIFASGSWKSSI